MNENRFNSYKENEIECWKNRLVFSTHGGKYPQWKTNVLNYLKYIKLSFSEINSASSLYTFVKNQAAQYATWAIENCTNAKYGEELKNHFVGCFGEIFAFVFFTHVKSVMINTTNNKYERYDFNHVCPRLIGEKDSGIDLTCTIDHFDKCYDGAIQVKFWNMFSDKMITYTEVGSNAFCDAVINHFINHDENKNIVIFWLGTDKKVSTALKESQLYNKLIFIDQNILDNTINLQMPSFWKELNKFIEYLTK